MNERARAAALAGGLMLVLHCAGCHLVFGDFEATGGTAEDTTCVEGAFLCDGATLQTCANGAWTAHQVCDAPDLCREDLDHCLVCHAGEHRCEGQQLQQCNAAGDGWTLVEECPASLVCDERAAHCGTCRSGAARCAPDGVTLDSCNASLSGWTSSLCGAGGCVDEPDDCDYCGNCSEEGEWVCSPCGKVLHCEGGVRQVIADCLDVNLCVVDSSGWYCLTE